MFDAAVFAHNRPRLDRRGATAAFFAGVRRRAVNVGLASEDHFSVAGTFIEIRAATTDSAPCFEHRLHPSPRTTPGSLSL